MWIWAIVLIIIVAGLILLAWNSNPSPTSDTPGAAGIEETEIPSSNAAANSENSTTGAVAIPPAVNTTENATRNVVQLTETAGFKPFVLEINRGESVEFVNASNKAMVIRSYSDKPENTYPGFSQESAPLGKGGKFSFGFSIPGAWAYYNLNSENDLGVIIVR